MRSKKVSSPSSVASKVTKTRNVTSVSSGVSKTRSRIVRRKIDTTAVIKGNTVDLTTVPSTVKKYSNPSNLTDYVKKKAKSKLSSMKDSAQAKLTDKMTNIKDMAYNAGVDMINSAKDQLIDYLNSILVIPEPVLLATLKMIADKGGSPTYKNHYPLKQIIIKDYSSIVDWMITRFKLSVTSGTDSRIFAQAPTMGATDTSLLVVERRKIIDSEPVFKDKRYQHIKDIITRCSTNFTSAKLLGAFSKYAILPSAYGTTGCEEYGKAYRFSEWEVNLFLPERKNGLIWETYPRSKGHVELMKNMMDANIWGDNRMVHAIIHKRIYNNVVIYNPIQSIATNLANDVLKETGLDKIIGICQSPEQLMYLYIQYLKKNNLF